MPKIPIFTATLLALTLTPIVSFADGNKTVIDVYQETIQKLNAEYEKLKQLTVDAQQKVTVFENEANRIKTLITDYEKALKTTTQQMEEKHEAKLKQIGKAYQESMAGEAKLTRLARESAQEDAKKTEALLDELGTTAEQVAKLTDAVSVSEDGKVHIQGPKTFINGTLDAKGGIIGGRNVGKKTIGAGDEGIIREVLVSPHRTKNGTSGAGFGFLEAPHVVSPIIWMYEYGDRNALQVIRKSWGGDISNDPVLFTIFVNGNVGIGTDSPQYKLDVKGQIRADNVAISSDERFKQNIHSLGGSLAKLAQVRGVRFNWKDNPKEEQIGLVAQEVEKVFPELVSTDSEGYKSIAYGKFTAILLEAVKEQQQQIDKMAQQIRTLGASAD